MALELASTNGAWPEDEFSGDPFRQLVDAMEKLAWLHGGESR